MILTIHTTHALHEIMKLAHSTECCYFCCVTVGKVTVTVYL